MKRTFGWCFIGAGNIAKRVLADLQWAQGAYIASVYARTPHSTAAFAEKSGAKACSSIEQAIAAPGVEAVYVAAPNHLHLPVALEALRMGKPVLVEKPFALNARQARQMIDAARQARVLLMEGMWTRFNPAIERMLQWIAQGRIGDVLGMKADFTSRSSKPLSERILLPEMGGGSLLDLGVYGVALARFLFKDAPARTHAVADLYPTGVDRQCAVLLQQASGAIVRILSSVDLPAANDAVIYGSKGTIHLPRFFAPDSITLQTPDAAETFDLNKQGEGFYYQFNAFMEDVRQGRLENDLLPHQYTMDTMALLDTIRSEAGIRFPQDDGD